MGNENTQEIWQTTTGGTFWVHVKDPRVPGGWSQKKVGGKGTKKVTLTVEERAFNQELISEEREHLDPFRNGLMIRIHPKDVDRGQNELTDEQIVELLQITDDAVFEEQMRAIDSEVILRRLLELSERHTTMWRHQSIKTHVDEKYRIGKTSKVVKEIFEDDAKYADADL